MSNRKVTKQAENKQSTGWIKSVKNGTICSKNEIPTLYIENIHAIERTNFEWL